MKSKLFSPIISTLFTVLSPLAFANGVFENDMGLVVVSSAPPFSQYIQASTEMRKSLGNGETIEIGSVQVASAVIEIIHDIRTCTGIGICPPYEEVRSIPLSLESGGNENYIHIFLEKRKSFKTVKFSIPMIIGNFSEGCSLRVKIKGTHPDHGNLVSEHQVYKSNCMSQSEWKMQQEIDRRFSLLPSGKTMPAWYRVP